MSESHSLERASQYLNNILLARGLLSNGRPIDFARPDRHASSTDGTMSRVINLVHDLVLRRDQDAEQREQLAIHIRQLRANETQRVLDLQKVQDKNVELARLASAAEAQERTLKANARKAEAQVKELKEHMLKMKSNLDQVRAKCLSDVRKRDTELDKLKAHMASMQRGKKESTGMKINTINFEPDFRGRQMRNGQEVDPNDWSLEQESNDFLAALVNETSTENVSLRRIVMETMEILRELTGMAEDAAAEQDEEEDGIGVPGQDRKSRRTAERQSQAEDLTSCAELAKQMTVVLEHCQAILKDPSFVSIEEVQIRDEEIAKLRHGWEKMASRWKEAITMMDSWRRQRVESGETVSMDELSKLEFGKSVAMLPNGQPVFDENDELSSILYEHSRLEEDEHEDGPAEAPSNMEPINILYPQLPRHDKIETVQEEEAELDIPKADERSPKRRASLARRAGLNIGKPMRPLQPVELNIRSPGHPSATMVPVSVTRSSADSGIGSIDELAEDVDENEDVWLEEEILKSRIPRRVSCQSLFSQIPASLTRDRLSVPNPA
jgi:hypothetical protein